MIENVPERISVSDLCLLSVALRAALSTSAAPSLKRSLAAASINCRKRSVRYEMDLMYTHLITDMYVEFIVVDSEVDIILPEWSWGVRNWKKRLRYINDIVVRNFNPLLGCE
jgi:hypothetical protein